jgi:hypothetical protein
MRRRLITLTTIPPRFGGIACVLEDLLAQGADGVVLALPRAWRRFPGPHALPDLPAGVTLLRCADLGPASKILPARRAFPDADLIACDDDCGYAPGWCAALCAGPGVRAGSVFEVARLRRRGGVVAQGFAGLRVPPDMSLPPDVPEPVRWVDDLWLSAWIAARGQAIERVDPARACVTPLSAPAPLQAGDRAALNAAAAAYIHGALGIWPPM